MNDPVNPFEAMLKAGQAWADKLGSPMEAFNAKGFETLWPTMSRDTMEAMMGKGLNPEGLDAKTRLLLTLMGLTVTGATADVQIRLTLRHLREAGATKQEITDTITLSALFGGAPAVTKALEIATAVLEEDAK